MKTLCERPPMIGAGLLVLALGLMPVTSAATILVFDQIRLPGGTVVPTISGNRAELDYGDRVSTGHMHVPGGQFVYGENGEGFTPNVVVELFAGNAAPNAPGVSLWEGGYGQLENVLYGGANSGSINVLLSADAGFEVDLYGFDVAGWPRADYTIDAVRVLQEATAVFTAADVAVLGATAPGWTRFVFDMPLRGPALLIRIDYGNLAGGQQDNIGIDNIRFGQYPAAVVPLPASWLLLAGASACLARRRRTRACAAVDRS